MDIYQTTVNDLPSQWGEKVTVVANLDELNRRLADEFCDMLAEKTRRNELLTVICPVGPVDYSYFAREMLKRGLSGRHLRTINMDEYIDDNGDWIPADHPLSFRKFLHDTFLAHLPEDKRPLPENVLFPDAHDPAKITRLIEEIGGADICWAGFGISGHIAFNDPPAMLGETHTLEALLQCRARTVVCSPVTNAQMAMGGTLGNWEILPARGVTLGMYELMMSKKFHAVFMRNWHAGLWRRALLGPVTPDFPGSILQRHPNLSVTMTELAARCPLVQPAQENGEKS